MRKVTIFFLTCLFIFCTQSLSIAQDEKKQKEAEKIQKMISDLQEEIKIINLVRELKLTNEQLKKLLACAKRAKQITEEYKRRLKALLPKFIKALKEFKKEDEANKGLSKKVERNAVRLEHREFDLRKRYYEKINELEDDVKKTLTEKQLELAKSYKPSVVPNQKRRKRAGRKELLKRIIKRIREIPEENFERFTEILVNNYLERIRRFRREKQKLSREQLQKIRKDLIKQIKEIRNMPEDEFEKKKEKMFDDFLKPKRKGKDKKLHKMKEEMKKFRKHKYGSIGKIGRLLINEKIVSVLEKILEKSEEVESRE